MHSDRRSPSLAGSALLLATLLALSLLPTTAQSNTFNFDPCCVDELENWDGYEGGNGLKNDQRENYRDIWERIRGKLSLGYHLHRSAVRTELDRFVRHLPSLYEMLESSAPYLHHVVSEIERRNMPMELALLPFIESQFNPHASSEYGATGIWQFMPSTARHFKMEMSWWFDDRRDVIRSTHFALNYLERLAQRFDGDWLLAVAAYNTGPQRVQDIRSETANQGHTRDFWALNLPRQTRRYVPAMIALAEIVRWGEVNGRALPMIPNEPYFQTVPLPGQADLLSVSERAGMDVESFFQLNAGFKRWAPNPEKPVRVLLPTALAQSFSTSMSEGMDPILVDWVAHLIRPGDNLSKIANLFDCRISELRQLNGLLSAEDDNLQIGQYLLVPAQGAPSKNWITRGGLIAITANADDSVRKLAERFGMQESEIRAAARLQSGEELQEGQRFRLLLGPEIPRVAVGKRSVFYLVRSGDTLSAIAARFDTSVSELIQLNGSETATLYPGSKIRIPIKDQP